MTKKGADVSWFPVITEQYKGDPFLTLVEFDGKRYVIDESVLIEQEEQTYRSLEMYFRMQNADAMRRHGLPWT
jgi:hypothetical protein